MYVLTCKDRLRDRETGKFPIDWRKVQSVPETARIGPRLVEKGPITVPKKYIIRHRTQVLIHLSEQCDGR